MSQEVALDAAFMISHTIRGNMTTWVIVYIYTPRGGPRLAYAETGTNAKKRYSIYYRDLNTT